jgi:hypothetical protein
MALPFASVRLTGRVAGCVVWLHAQVVKHAVTMTATIKRRVDVKVMPRK